MELTFQLIDHRLERVAVHRADIRDDSWDAVNVAALVKKLAGGLAASRCCSAFNCRSSSFCVSRAHRAFGPTRQLAS